MYTGTTRAAQVWSGAFVTKPGGFEAVGMSFANRVSRTRKWIAMLKTLWAEKTPLSTDETLC